MIPITAAFAAICGIIMTILSFRVTMRRVEIGKSTGQIAAGHYGDCNDEKLRKRMRGFGNFIEYTPMVLLLMALSEMAHAPSRMLCLLGSAFVLGRICHATLGMNIDPNKPPVWRIFGMMPTHGCIVVLSLWLLKTIYL